MKASLLGVIGLFGIVAMSSVQFVRVSTPAWASDNPIAACEKGVEIIRLWIRATDPNAPSEEREKVRLRVERANADCIEARKVAPGDNQLLVTSAYALFALGDKSAGVKLIAKAAEAGYPPAMLMMARYMGNGDTVDKDVEAAWMLLIQSLQSNHASTRIKAALEFMPGGVGPESPKRATRTLRELVGEGNGEAMVALAMHVLDLKTAEPGSERAIEGLDLLENAASEAGNGTAMIFLSLLHNQGDVVERDAEKAKVYAQMAIDVGIKRAYGTMGQIYQNQGDMKTAVEWFHKGAAANDGFSQGMLGFMYSGGFGIIQDIEQAIKWWTKGRWNGDRLSAGYLQVYRDKQAEKKAYEDKKKEERKKTKKIGKTPNKN